MRNERVIDGLLRTFGAAVYVFLFAPIVVVIVFSFNSGRHVAELTGLSFRWYVEAWTNPFVVDAFWTSVSIAITAASISTLIGTAAALSMPSAPRLVRRTFDTFVSVAIVVPGIVLGISMLIFVVSLTSWLNAWIAYLAPASDVRLGLGFLSVVAAHSVFGTAIVAVLVRTRLLSLDAGVLEASSDLYATPVRTLAMVTLPMLRPAIIAGFLLAFTFSFDDFIVAFFTRGQAQTLPIFLFASIRRGVTPVVNATASSLLAMTLALLVTAALVLRRRESSRMAAR